MEVKVGVDAYEILKVTLRAQPAAILHTADGWEQAHQWHQAMHGGVRVESVSQRPAPNALLLRGTATPASTTAACLN